MNDNNKDTFARFHHYSNHSGILSLCNIEMLVRILTISSRVIGNHVYRPSCVVFVITLCHFLHRNNISPAFLILESRPDHFLPTQGQSWLLFPYQRVTSTHQFVHTNILGYSTHIGELPPIPHFLHRFGLGSDISLISFRILV